ncbi:type I secretion system permease/ATPase [Caulobacter endophyticus]|uniref:Type I secretion system permease/ATPase n=1 Tax=Caulobacter endophyticus TaxID=2172652 RepID=A0A2T9JTU3_9CAUL|nr:type I secretion system permease/ATPase [Caulobacter endophyticus]PVM87120.1 type I secretion system permease/ATPase [Caulobacter endophyticus]
MKLLDGPIPSVLADAVRTCRRHFVGVALFSALMNILYIAPTIYMMQVYDRVVPTEGRLTLLYLTGVVAFALATLAALEAVRGRLLILASLRLDRVLGGPILTRLMSRLGPATTQQGMRDFDTVRAALTGPAALAVIDAPWTPFYALVAFLIHPALGALTVAGGVLLVWLALANEKATRTRQQDAAQAQAVAYAVQEASASNAETVRALGMGRNLRERQLSERSRGLDLVAKAQFTGGRYAAATKFVRLFLQSAALGLGAWLAVERQISAGSIIAASVLLSRALQPVEQLVGSWTVVGQARNAMNNLLRLFSEADAGRGGTQLPPPRGVLSLEQASVRAPGQSALLLRGVTMRVEPGEIVGVIGPSGAGKTTLAKLAAGAISPDAGLVRLDGANLLDWTADRLGRHVGYLPQDSGLMAGTIRDNIARFEVADEERNAEAIDTAVIAAAQTAGVHELILQLPRGYDTVLGLGGRGLSAGQAQRIALARALYRDPVLIVLDEPNSALDAEGEAALAAAVRLVRKRGGAVIIVAHRAAILSSADRLVLLVEGRVERDGPREEVMKEMAQRASAVKRAPVVSRTGS